MADERRYMDAAEFQRLGFLQEVNRQFLHPHGLALSVRLIDSDWTAEEISKSAWMREEISNVMAALASVVAGDEEALHDAALAVCRGLYPKGSTYFAEIWDSRDDPEGIYFADGVDVEKERRVCDERVAHYAARCRFLGNEWALPVEGSIAGSEGVRLPEDAPDVQRAEWEPPKDG